MKVCSSAIPTGEYQQMGAGPAKFDWRRIRVAKTWLVPVLALLLVASACLLHSADLYRNLAPKRRTNGLSQANKNSGNWRPILEGIDMEMRVPPEFDRFIHTGVMNGRLGNQLFRFASLYAMGQMLGRSPAYVYNEDTLKEMDDELADTFPELHKRVYFLKPYQKTHKEHLARSCCDYKDPKILLLRNNASAVLQVLGVPNFENHKYFHHMRERILDLFQFHPKLLKKVEKAKRQIFGADASPKLCVHTRVGDFKGLGMSRKDQVGAAIDFVMRMLELTKNWRQFSLLMFGENREFAQTVQVNNNQSISEVYYAIDANLTRGEELALASVGCDAFVSTAPLSSFAFWMGYLMPERRPKFFIRKMLTFEEHIDTLDTLPPEWSPIEERWLAGI